MAGDPTKPGPAVSTAEPSAVTATSPKPKHEMRGGVAPSTEHAKLALPAPEHLQNEAALWKERRDAGDGPNRCTEFPARDPPGPVDETQSARRAPSWPETRQLSSAHPRGAQLVRSLFAMLHQHADGTPLKDLTARLKASPDAVKETVDVLQILELVQREGDLVKINARFEFSTWQDLFFDDVANANASAVTPQAAPQEQLGRPTLARRRHRTTALPGLATSQDMHIILERIGNAQARKRVRLLDQCTKHVSLKRRAVSGSARGASSTRGHLYIMAEQLEQAILPPQPLKQPRMYYRAGRSNTEMAKAIVGGNDHLPLHRGVEPTIEGSPQEKQTVGESQTPHQGSAKNSSCPSSSAEGVDSIDNCRAQIVVLRGPPGAELTVSPAAQTSSGTPTFTMALKSPRNAQPLQSYLVHQAELTDLFNAPLVES